MSRIHLPAQTRRARRVEKVAAATSLQQATVNAHESADVEPMNFLSREATVAKPGFNRWLVPPAAIAVHMCIGEVYGFSVFNVPLTQAGAGWTIPQVGW